MYKVCDHMYPKNEALLPNDKKTLCTKSLPEPDAIKIPGHKWIHQASTIMNGTCADWFSNFYLTCSFFDDCENICTSSYYHHQLKNDLLAIL